MRLRASGIAGRQVGAWESRGEPLIAVGHRRATELLEPFTRLEPGRVVQYPNRALPRVQGQARQGLDPGFDAVQVIG